MGVCAYPFMAFASPVSGRMGVMCKFEGILNVDEIIGDLDRLIDEMDIQLSVQRSDRASSETSRTIRQQQDAAYEASLQADRNKAQKEKEARELAKIEIVEAERRQSVVDRVRADKLERRAMLLCNLPPEPSAAAPDISKLGIRLPDGTRLIRRFIATDTLESLYDFVESHDLSPIPLESDFIIVNSYPRKVLEASETFQQAGLCPNASVLVEEASK